MQRRKQTERIEESCARCSRRDGQQRGVEIAQPIERFGDQPDLPSRIDYAIVGGQHPCPVQAGDDDRNDPGNHDDPAKQRRPRSAEPARSRRRGPRIFARDRNEGPESGASVAGQKFVPKMVAKLSQPADPRRSDWSDWRSGTRPRKRAPTDRRSAKGKRLLRARPAGPAARRMRAARLDGQEEWRVVSMTRAPTGASTIAFILSRPYPRAMMRSAAARAPPRSAQLPLKTPAWRRSLLIHVAAIRNGASKYT